MAIAIDETGRTKEEIEAMEVAEASRETEWSNPSFLGNLFMGNFDPSLILPFPTQDPEDKKIGDEFLARLRTFCETKVDGDLIDREKDIPPDVLKGLTELGCFGIKIPKSYGGLGFSQMNYLRALALISEYCGSIAATLSAHQSIGVPQPLLLFGTDEQKQKYLPRMAKGAISAFALTEPEVGSDPAKLSTFAEPSEDGEHYILNGKKLWCTNGPFAELLVVMARTPSITVKGREKQQITAFIVETNDPGFEVIHRCRFMGLNGVQNGLLSFKDIKVPKENIIWGLGKGLKLALITLNAGRLSLPATCVGGGRQGLRAARKWANDRVQWGVAIGKHEAGASKLASLAASNFSIEAATFLGGAWVDRKAQDIRLEAAAAKFFASVDGQHQADETLQLRGGRGYETADSLRARGDMPAPIERWYRDGRINQIVEGTNEIMTLFISREALDKHLQLAGDALNPKLPMIKRLLTLVRAGFFYMFWYPRQWMSFLWWFRFWGHGRLGKHLRFVGINTHKMARAMFHMMLRYGPKLEKKQRQLRRIVEIGVRLFAMSATISYAISLKKNGEKPGCELLADQFCRESKKYIRSRFREICCNDDDATYKVGRKVLSGDYAWHEEYS